MRLIVVIMLFLFSSAALADEQIFIFGKDLSWIGVQRAGGVDVFISDQVTDGCWLTAGTAKSGAELEFVRSGVAIEDDAAPIWFSVGVLGFDLGSGYCVVSLNIYVFAPHFSEHHNGTLSAVAYTRRLIWTDNFLLTGDKSSMSARINEQVIGAARAFLVESDKQYRAIVDQIGEEAAEEHRAAWRAYFAE